MATYPQPGATASKLESLRVISVDEDWRRRWDEFVETHPHGTMYHLTGWKEVFERTFGYRSFFLSAVNGSGDIQGVVPLFLMRDVFRRKYLVSNPFSNFAGICAEGRSAHELLLERATEIAREHGVEYIELRQLGRPLYPELISQQLPRKESFVTLMLELESDPDLHWQRLSSRNRGKVRKALRAEIEAEVSTTHLDDFYAIFTRNMRHLGTPTHPKRLFENILSAFPERANLLSLKLDGKIVSGMFLFAFGDVLSEPWVSSLREYHHLYVNNLLYWKAIEYACEHRFSAFDFGRSTAGSGTYDFKLQWGAQPVPLYYEYFLNKASEVPVVDAFDNQYERYIAIWKKLPLWVTQVAGPRVVKFLPQL